MLKAHDGSQQFQLHLDFLIGKIIPVDTGTVLTSVLLFFVGPFVISYLIQKLAKSRNSKDYLSGNSKKWTGSVKLWGLVLVLVTMFASQGPLELTGAAEVALLIVFLIGFFAVQFVIAITIGTFLNLGYEDTVTLSFTTTARNSEAVIGIAIAAFPGQPLVYLAIILGPVIELPVLLAISGVLLRLKEKVGKRSALHPFLRGERLHGTLKS